MSSAERLTIEPDGRFARLEAITWWDQAKLAAARVLVVGAGALGNEIVKNLALLGVGHVLIVDRDTVERSNLSRSVLYRDADVGRPKASVAAEAARRIFPDMLAHAVVGDAITTLGTNAFRWADVAFGGLDNRECRLHVNRQCWRFGKPWVDGAIEQIQGVARLFQPDPAQESACYECTLGERDFQLLAQRRSCNMLTRVQMETGHTPTTPTIASIIAAIQVQEWLKHLHGLPTTPGEAFAFVGQSGDGFRISYPRRPDCLAHETLPDVIELDAGVDDLTLGELLDAAESRLGSGATIDLGRDIVTHFDCPRCGQSEAVFRPLGALVAGEAICRRCDGESIRAPQIITTIDRGSPWLDRSVGGLGVPAFDVLTARAADRSVGLAFAGDAARLLGPLVDDGGGLTWLT